MTILLDTHAWLWWVSDPDMLSSDARKAVDDAAADRSIHVSSISAWEVAVLVAKGRLKLSMGVEDWVKRSEGLPFITFLPVSNAIALKSVFLPEPFHNDPADRIIVATTMAMGSSLITKDRKILAYPHVKTLW